jgi:hypothetical protein
MITNLSVEEIYFILNLIQEKYGLFGYSDNEELSKLQAKLSIVGQAASMCNNHTQPIQIQETK